MPTSLMKPAGKVTVAVEFAPDTPAPEQSGTPFAPARLVAGVVTLALNGKAVGSAHIPGIGNNSDTFDIGYERGSPVSNSYTSRLCLRERWRACAWN
jgi:hypothetical protein